MTKGSLIELTEEQKIAEMMERCKERAGNVEQPDIGEKYNLPFWNEQSRAIPNHLTRTCLFAPIAKGRRKIHDWTVLASRVDVKITFFGKQLDEADRDVFLQALHEARKVALGEAVVINRADFLKNIGRNTGKSQYDWLEESFLRLTSGTLLIETKKYKLGEIVEINSEEIKRLEKQQNLKNKPRKSALHLVAGYDYYPEDGVYKLSIDPRILTLFGNREFALVDWEKRKQITKKVDLVKWLQCLIASNEKGQQKYSLNDLKSWMDYNGRIRDFKSYIDEAIKELERLKIISQGKIGLSTKKEDQVSWIRL